VPWCLSIAEAVRRDAEVEGNVRARLRALIERNSRGRFTRRGQYIVGLCDKHGIMSHCVAVGNLRGYGMVVSSHRRRWCVNLCEESLLTPAGDDDEKALPTCVGAAFVYELAFKGKPYATSIPGATSLTIPETAPPMETTIYLAPFTGRNPSLCVPSTRAACGSSLDIAFPHEGDRYDVFWACVNVVDGLSSEMARHFAAHKNRLASDCGIPAINRYMKRLGAYFRGCRFVEVDWVHALAEDQELDCRYTIAERKKDLFVAGMEARRSGDHHGYVVFMVDAEGNNRLHIAVVTDAWDRVQVKNPYAQKEHAIIPETIVQLPHPDDDYAIASGVGEVYELVDDSRR